MENIHKSKAELLNELELLQKEHASLKLAYQNDIIEKKLAEESLIQNEARLSAFMQHIPSLIMIKDNELRPIYANNNLKEIFPYDEWEGKAPQEIFPKEIADAMIAEDQIALNEGYTSYEEEWIDSKGINHIYSTQKFRINIPDSKPLLGAIITDISDRKKIENELRESEFKYRALIEYSNDVIFCVDKDGYYKFVNHVFASTFGQEPEYFNGKTFWDVYPKEHADHRFEASSKVFETGEAGSVEVFVPLPDRTLYYIAKTNPVKDENGKVILNLTHATDITERKIAEEALKESEVRLRELNATKDRFFSIIAHDLRNPLGNLKDVTKLLHESYKDFSEIERIEFLDLMKESSKNIYSLLENLLDWSRAQRGVLKFNPSEFNLKLLVSDVIKLFKPTAENKSINIECNINGAISINADINMLHTIFRNLISNALKFTKENGAIVINVESIDDMIKCSVIDNGVGMPIETIEKLFRIDASITSLGTNNESGTGLGLILCKELIEKHNGKIWVESIEGKGSTFYFTLPKINNYLF